MQFGLSSESYGGGAKAFRRNVDGVTQGDQSRQQIWEHK